MRVESPVDIQSTLNQNRSGLYNISLNNRQYNILPIVQMSSQRERVLISVSNTRAQEFSSRSGYN